MEKITDTLAVDVESLDSIAMGLRDDMQLLSAVLRDMHDDIHGLDEDWNNKDHDDFLSFYSSEEFFVQSCFESLKECVEGLTNAVGHYAALEEELNSMAAGW